MRFFGLPVFAFSLLWLAGCQTANYYTPTVESWRHATVSTLLKRWGQPDIQVKRPGGGEVLLYKTVSYKSFNTSFSPEVGVNFTPGGHPVIVTLPASPGSRAATVVTCTTLFESNAKGEIIDVQSRGSGCYGGEAFRKQRGNEKTTSPLQVPKDSLL